MKEIQLTRGQVALVDDEDYNRVSNMPWFAIPGRNGYYAISHTSKKETNGMQKTIHLGRFILGLSDRKTLCDHIDRNPLNNQKNNLRVANYNQNCANITPAKNKSSKYLGVSFIKKSNIKRRWRAQIRSYGECIELGCFENEIDAAIAYNMAASKIHGEFASLNKIPC